MTAARFKEMMEELTDESLRRMSTAMKELSDPEAASRIANVIEG